MGPMPQMGGVGMLGCWDVEVWIVGRFVEVR